MSPALTVQNSVKYFYLKNYICFFLDYLNSLFIIAFLFAPTFSSLFYFLYHAFFNSVFVHLNYLKCSWFSICWLYLVSCFTSYLKRTLDRSSHWTADSKSWRLCGELVWSEFVYSTRYPRILWLGPLEVSLGLRPPQELLMAEHWWKCSSGIFSERLPWFLPWPS